MTATDTPTNTTPPHRRDRHNDSGFSLIELTVVVVIVGALIAIMVPTFLGARSKAQDRATIANLRVAALTGYGEAYGGTGAATFNGNSAIITQQVPELTMVAYDADSAGARQVSMWGGRGYATTNGFWMSAAARTPDGTKCWAVYVPSTGANAGKFVWASTTAVACNAQATLGGIPTNSWGNL